MEDAEKVVKMRPEYAPAHGTLAVASYGQKDFIGARRSYAKALELSPGNADYEAGVKASEEATEDAKDAARKAVRPRPALQDCATLRRFRALSLINHSHSTLTLSNFAPPTPPISSPPAPTPSTHSFHPLPLNDEHRCLQVPELIQKFTAEGALEILKSHERTKDYFKDKGFCKNLEEIRQEDHEEGAKKLKECVAAFQ